MIDTLNKLEKDLEMINNFLIAAFKSSEYETYMDIKKKEKIPFVEKNFFYEKDLNLDALDSTSQLDTKKFKEKDVFDALHANDDTYIKAKRKTYDSDKIALCYVAIDQNGKLLFAKFNKTKFCKEIIDHAYFNQGFIMSDGVNPAMEYGKGIYNYRTFKRDYFNQESKKRKIINYQIKTFDVPIEKYVNYVKAIKLKKNAPKRKKK
jgi:hypothetical protein